MKRLFLGSYGCWVTVCGWQCLMILIEGTKIMANAFEFWEGALNCFVEIPKRLRLLFVPQMHSLYVFSRTMFNF
jgi:hypothetical protein